MFPAPLHAMLWRLLFWLVWGALVAPGVVLLGAATALMRAASVVAEYLQPLRHASRAAATWARQDPWFAREATDPMTYLARLLAEWRDDWGLTGVRLLIGLFGASLIALQIATGADVTDCRLADPGVWCVRNTTAVGLRLGIGFTVWGVLAASAYLRRSAHGWRWLAVLWSVELVIVAVASSTGSLIVWGENVNALLLGAFFFAFADVTTAVACAVVAGLKSRTYEGTAVAHGIGALLLFSVPLTSLRPAPAAVACAVIALLGALSFRIHRCLAGRGWQHVRPVA